MLNPPISFQNLLLYYHQCILDTNNARHTIKKSLNRIAKLAKRNQRAKDSMHEHDCITPSLALVTNSQRYEEASKDFCDSALSAERSRFCTAARILCEMASYNMCCLDQLTALKSQVDHTFYLANAPAAVPYNDQLHSKLKHLDYYSRKQHTESNTSRRISNTHLSVTSKSSHDQLTDQEVADMYSRVDKTNVAAMEESSTSPSDDEVCR